MRAQLASTALTARLQVGAAIGHLDAVGVHLVSLTPALARDTLPGVPGVGDRHGPQRCAELLWMRERLAKHGRGKYGRQHERVAVQDAVVECRSDGGTADVDGVVVDDPVWAVVNLPAEPVQGAELPGVVDA
jgi:hypothetical protein